MGTLNCLKCAQTVDAPSFAQADSIIDHAACSRTCSGNPDYMRWNGEKLGLAETVAVPTIKKSNITKPSKRK